MSDQCERDLGAEEVQSPEGVLISSARLRGELTSANISGCSVDTMEEGVSNMCEGADSAN